MSRHLVAILVLSLVAGAGCSDDGSDGDGAEVGVTTTAGAASEAAVEAPIDDPCAVVTLEEATELVGTAMTTAPADSEGPIASCKYVSETAADPAGAEGVVVAQLRVDLFDGSQFFDLDGVGYPKTERDDLALGDRGFAHHGDADRGVTVQFEIGEMVYQVNYTETAVLTDAPADADRVVDGLVELLQTRFADWTV